MRRARTRARALVSLFWCFSLCCCCCFFSSSVCALITGSSSGSACFDIRTSSLDTHTQEWTRAPRRSLGGPGSYPPRCIGKCGRCAPCRPVRVTVPPGTPVTTEYYPEAWRCKCGNRLYIP